MRFYLWKWLLTLSVLAMAAAPWSTALADWVDVTGSFVISTEPSVADDQTTVKVALSNITNEIIEGDLRLMVVTEGTTPDPTNATGIAGEDGSDPTAYFTIGTDHELVFDQDETVTIEMIFPTADALGYSLRVELNDESLASGIFRKKISKTPELYSGEAKIQVLPRYVPARNTKGQLLYKSQSTDGFVPCDDPTTAEVEACPANSWKNGAITMVKPIIVSYLQEVEGTTYNNVPEYDGNEDGVYDDGVRLAHDVYAAVSYDDGATWKRTNISRTSTKSSFTLENGVAYPGDSESAELVVAGDYALVTWVDKECRNGNPWGMPDDWADPYQTMGPQRSVDYLDVSGDEDPRPDLGERPFSCLWAARGILDSRETIEVNGEAVANPDFGSIVWYQGEQLSTGRRDAIRNFPAAVEPNIGGQGPGGFAVTWQEDPKGLKTGKGRGPGAGMSGASVNHKTDIWYSYIPYADLAAADNDYASNAGDGDGEPTPDGDQGGYTTYIDIHGHIYNPYENLDEQGNPIKFSDLPEDWTCSMDGCTATKADFAKITKPHPLNHFSTPVRLSDNAVCRQRNPTAVMGHVHTADHIAETGCDYYYEGGTENQPIAWEDLPDTWVCPKCGASKATFEAEATFIKWRNEGAPYCEAFAGNSRVDGDGNVVSSDDPAYDLAYYTSNEGEPLDGNTGASRPNLSLVNYLGETLALVAYEETKGIGTGSDKQAAAMEQAAPYPLVHMADGTWEAGATNRDCRSCHYHNLVPRDRVIPVDNETTCVEVKNGVWKPDLEAYYPYTGYPLITEDPLAVLPSEDTINNPQTGVPHRVNCVKFEAGKGMFPKDYEQIDPLNNYYALPDHMPGWHQEGLDCSRCHLPYNTKDLDVDGVPDRADQCPDTVLDDPSTLDLVSTSDRYGCTASQTPVDPDDPDNNKDAPDRYRHGKNIYYHYFSLDDPDTIRHGYQVNLENAYDWSEQGDIYENARRVRVVANPVFDPTNPESVALGLLYKEGKDGQGAPADAMLQLFKGGFDPENIVRVNGQPRVWNLSSSTPYIYQAAEVTDDEESISDNLAGDGSGDSIGNHNTPKIERYYWTMDNLNDPSGLWLDSDGDGTKDWITDVLDNEAPDVRANPFENVFSTRLVIHGDFIGVGFAYCANWAAGKKAHDHYDFFIRTSKDGGTTWTLPKNVSQLKNHEESVSDCRIILPPPTLVPPGMADVPLTTLLSNDQMPETDLFDPDMLMVAIGTKENTPQPAPNVTELEEDEIFYDVFYSRSADLGATFDSELKENPKYDSEAETPALQYIDNLTGLETDNAIDDNGIPNEGNPSYGAEIEEFDWLAKGDAFQGDVQMVTNPNGTILHGIWEQELALDEESTQSHFQGSDVWYRKADYHGNGDANGDGLVNRTDLTLLLSYRNQPASVCRACDIDGDGIITVVDARRLYLLMN